MTDAAHWHGPVIFLVKHLEKKGVVNQKKTITKNSVMIPKNQKKRANYYVTNLLQMKHLGSEPYSVWLG